MISLGRSARSSLWAASAGRRRRCAGARLHEARHSHGCRRTRRDSFRVARRPAALHLSRILHAGMQGWREGQHADHARAGCDCARRRDSRAFHGFRASCCAATDAPTAFSTSIARASERFQRARAVIVAGYSIETPRLLLNSACPGHEHGLANSSGTLGRFLMAQAGNVVPAGSQI